MLDIPAQRKIIINKRNIQPEIYPPIFSTHQNLKQLLPSTKQQIYMEENKVDHHQSDEKISPNKKSSFVILNQFYNNEPIKSKKLCTEKTTNLNSLLYQSNKKPDNSFCCVKNTRLDVSCNTRQCVIF
ncbi:hypothetical protein N9Y17_01975 [Gammaproteobacteria bacterium]|nr:hypothetical protein [Gammaproteobacteria bacterium]